jgi:tetrapyrrole methylase family protein/MazG family protein
LGDYILKQPQISSQGKLVAYRRKLDNFATLLDIIARLRGPQGCSWDREQTHLSLKPNLLEECYEALEAIDQGDDEKLSEELGDLLMQIVLHAQIAAEQGKFDIGNVLQGINTKLIHRHPHVFGKAKAKETREVVLSWEALKQEEREEAPLLSSLPKGMPALAHSQAMQRRAARIGFDWREFSGVIEKLFEEIKELGQTTDHQERVREFGDLLFTLANVARWLDVELEDALRLANERFYRRFDYMEEACRRRGISLDKLSLEEKDKLWEEAKQALHPDSKES